MPILGIEQDDAVSGDDARFPEHESPNDFELWDARDLGLALMELADSADRD